MYIEKLYESVEEQIKAATLILDLAQQPANLEELVNDETLLKVIARQLKQEARKDIDLTTVIISIFSCFAAYHFRFLFLFFIFYFQYCINTENISFYLFFIFFLFHRYTQFHPVILQHRLGHTCMKLVDREMERRHVLDSDLETARTSLQTASDKMGAKEAFQKVSLKVERIKSKQEALLAVCFSVLLHLAEDMAIEKKMKKHNIVKNLVAVLDAENPDLLSVVLLFLKKLSIIKENKDEMANRDIVSMLSRLIQAPSVHEGHVHTALRLLLNLSFSAVLQAQMANAGLIPRLVGYIRDPNLRQTALRILYHLSMDDKHKSLFTYTEAIPYTIKMALDEPSDRVNREVIALAVNLASNQRNAELMCDGNNMQLMVKRAVKTFDPLLFKLMKTISSHEGKPREYFIANISVVADIIRMAKTVQNSDLLVELLGILGNLSGPGINWVKLAEDHNLVPLLTKFLQPGAGEDDVILEAIIVLGTIASDPKSANLLFNTSTIPSLAELIVNKQEDDEIVLQCVYTFYRLLLLPDPREMLLKQTQVPSYFIDLLYDKNSEIQKLADQALDLIMDYDIEWAKKIRKKKFQRYNSEWIKAVQGFEAMGVYSKDATHDTYKDFDSDEGF
eukprot:Phypoly_transcript_02714.p1 GENE.Phypoly_transcript_02714~~Phypoly_transcript_02714.p1  ORF type:complete len:620 (+),score=86.23 Phypoly_transcript_02714:716-2575(+)